VSKRLAGHERSNHGLGDSSRRRAGVSKRDHLFDGRVQHHDAVSDLKDARQLVGDDHEGSLEQAVERQESIRRGRRR